MYKTIIIALLVGIVIGQIATVRADNETGAITTFTRHDLMEAAALTGILANANYYPLGNWGLLHGIKGPNSFRQAAKEYADALQ